MATAPAHPRKEDRENQSEKDVKTSRLQWRRFIIITFCLIAALRFTFWIHPKMEAFRSEYFTSTPTATATANIIGSTPTTIAATDANHAPWYLTPPSPPKDSPTRMIVCADPGPGPDTYALYVNHDPHREFTNDDLLSGDLTSLQFVGDRAVTIWAKTVSRSSDPTTWCR